MLFTVKNKKFEQQQPQRQLPKHRPAKKKYIKHMLNLISRDKSSEIKPKHTINLPKKMINNMNLSKHQKLMAQDGDFEFQPSQT